MKNLKHLALSLLTLTAISCKETPKNTPEPTPAATTTTQPETNTANSYQIIDSATTVNFTAYKTTDKVAVKGSFQKINLTNTKQAKTALEALHGTQFSIPVKSLYTNDASGTRDPKILKFFFGTMKNTQLISGVFKVADNNQCSIDVTLNGKTANIPLKYTANTDTKLSFDGIMHLENWDALAAVAAINKACLALHTGKDGVSKTWNEVALHAEVLLHKN
ncbi:YceI family protein [Flavobacterium crassostreae]|uniref:Uncharacterized protein n=1 Tax=Flavobacterium crassostreae TaxID=1763534 RepID=A0A1B9E9N0_9FLAO|nr:YceI family protein [Flavobacterium crassostreae]OCB78646.1 hypothetical protein LPBF_01230 [Flavobacterium crassostreae]